MEKSREKEEKNKTKADFSNVQASLIKGSVSTISILFHLQFFDFSTKQAKQ